MTVTPRGSDVSAHATSGAADHGTSWPLPMPPGVAAVAAHSRDLADAMVAVVAVSVALTRYVLGPPVRNAGSVLGRPGSAHPLRRERHQLRVTVTSLAARAAQRLATTVGELADVVVPSTVQAMLSRLDLTALVLQHVDLDRIVAAVDVESVAAGLDLDTLVEKVDVARVLDRIDLDEVVSRVDLDTAVGRVDLDRIVDKVDIARVLDRIDLDEVVSRVDLDTAVDRVDLDRIIARADVVSLTRYVVEQIDLPELIRYSTGSVSTEMVRSVRDQSADADRAVERVVDRLLRRHGRRTEDLPAAGADRPEDRP